MSDLRRALEEYADVLCDYCADRHADADRSVSKRLAALVARAERIEIAAHDVVGWQSNVVEEHYALAAAIDALEAALAPVTEEP
jgi:hypothetical protein